MKKLLAILLALVLTLGLAACGGGGSAAPDPNSGVYEAVSAEMAGVSVDVDDVFENGFSLELKDGGKAVFHYDGKDYNLRWSLNGTAFEAKGAGATLNGTLSAGVLEITDVLGSGVNITLVDPTKATTTPSAEPSSEPSAEPSEEPSPAASPADDEKAGSDDGGKSSEGSGSGGSLNAPVTSPSGEKSGEGVSLTNGLDAEIHSFYISSQSSTSWGDRVNDSRIPIGQTVTFDGSVLVDGDATYDVAAVDENKRNYDIYDVELAAGDTIIIAADGDVATVIVNGSKIFTGEAYDPDDEAYVTVQNNLDTEIHSFYVSSPSSDSWGERVNSSHIAAGAALRLDSSCLVDGNGSYDIAAVDENKMNYDIYGVELAAGDTIAISADGDVSTITVNGSSVYTGEAYIPEE